MGWISYIATVFCRHVSRLVVDWCVKCLLVMLFSDILNISIVMG